LIGDPKIRKGACRSSAVVGGAKWKFPGVKYTVSGKATLSECMPKVTRSKLYNPIVSRCPHGRKAKKDRVPVPEQIQSEPPNR
jgi:hypothetical protein